MVKKCLYCGKYFVPNKKVGEKQKACSMQECKKARKHEAQRNWVKKNPDYFKDNYWRVKEWRMKKKQNLSAQKIKQDMIQDEIPHQTPYQELILMIPDSITGMIQDEIRLKRIDAHRFSAYG